MARRKSAGSDVVYQIKVTLEGFRPPIWRRLQVRADTRLPALHDIIQSAMGWDGYHLHQFEVGGQMIGPPDPDGMLDVSDERRFTLSQIAPAEKTKFAYVYDFGDNWEHQILVEKILPAQPDTHYPTCLTGRRACPPEDVGGVWGYAEFLEAIHDPKHPEHENLLEWIGGEFDPAAFDLDEINARLQASG